MRALTFGERYERLAGDVFEVTREPAADVVAILTVPAFPVDAALIAALPALRAIGTASVGFDHIDVSAAEARGIAVVSVPEYCTEEVADHTLALVYALVRGIVALDRDVARGGWNPKAAGPLHRLGDFRVGIVGLARIGKAVARRLVALGLEVWAYDILPEAFGGVRHVELDELLAGCNALTLHVPLTPRTRGMIGRSEIAAMPPGSLLVNTSRGGVVALDAVLEALRSGHLGGAALDVLPQEPPPLPPIVPNLILTPHAAYYSEEAEESAARLAVARVSEILGVG